ncbi:MAG: polyphenol oxidase [Rhodospirillaceae bacterium]|nr:polyphenol oxidase [Rhodospirillaceae bacterium]|tara:strand:- start:2172 stop:2933 length:762 start_codon:yes stop_codon:yes gene_type:complete
MIISSQLLSDHAHGFFTRNGGVSEGIYSSLNCGLGSGDNHELVAENRKRAMGRLGLQSLKLITCSQVHGAGVLTIANNGVLGNPEKSDALVSGQVGVAVGVLTADCAPVLMADHNSGVVGAVHAGWKGALTGVLEAAVSSMERLGSHISDIRAVIGPCISQSSYEVGPEFRARFEASGCNADLFFKRSSNKNHYMFDLEGYIVVRMEGLGIGQIERSGLDTYEDVDNFFSYRRSQHLLEGGYGRSLSLISVHS